MKSSLRPILFTLSLGCVVASIGCGAGSAVTGATAKDSRIRGIVVASASGAVASSDAVTALSSRPVAATPSNKPVAGVRVSIANTGQSVVTDSKGQFLLNTAAGTNQLQFDNGARGSVNVDTAKGMEANVAVALSGQNATLTCLANQPMGATNLTSACDLGGGIEGGNGSNQDGNRDGGSNGDNQDGGGSNGGSNGGN